MSIFIILCYKIQIPLRRSPHERGAETPELRRLHDAISEGAATSPFFVARAFTPVPNRRLADAREHKYFKHPSTSSVSGWVWSHSILLKNTVRSSSAPYFYIIQAVLRFFTPSGFTRRVLFEQNDKRTT